MKRSYEQISVGPITIQPLIEPSDSSGAVAIHEFSVPAGTGLPVPHYHEAYEETIYGVRGVLTFTVDGVAHDITAGSTLFVPRGATHSFACNDVDAAALAIITPGLLSADYFRELGAVLGSSTNGSPDFAAISDVMQHHGLIPVS
jgi:quercetin dioxygenase-like cupin family protein